MNYVKTRTDGEKFCFPCKSTVVENSQFCEIVLTCSKCDGIFGYYYIIANFLWSVCEGI